MKTIITSSLIVTASALLLMSCNKDEIIQSVTVTVPGEGNFRPATAASSATSTRVYEWTPAPGQFINETTMIQSISGDVTPEKAAEWAQKRLDDRLYVSLGGFGGYIVVGFDHSIANSKGSYDFAIMGNSYFNEATGQGGSNEPGIVYVMQDTNGNGLPDDTWYELRGSETGKPGTMRDYAVTYTRPSAPGSDVQWTDNKGNSGTISYIGFVHTQDYYYPLWIKSDSYTLTGTCLAARTSQYASTGMWNNNPYEWGYADNMGQDNTETVYGKQCNRFRISDAINADGTDASLSYIDFVKVQTGVNSKAGALGEVSTEVFGFADLSILK